MASVIADPQDRIWDVLTLEALAERYDAFLIDQFGVIHDGAQAYEGAVDAMSYLQRRGRKVVIISNSSRRKGDTVARLRSMVAFHAMEGRRLSQDQQRELTMMIRREIMSLRWRSVDSNLTVKSPARTDDDADDTADDAAESDDGAESAEAEGAPAAADSGEQEAGDE